MSDSKQERRRTMMLTMPIPSLVPRMAVPTIVSMLVTSFYNMADTFFVSKLGDAATGAVGVNMSLTSMISMIGMAIAVGANSYIARLLGANRDEQAQQTLSTSFFTAFGIGLLLTAAGLIFMDPLVRLLGAKDPTPFLGVDAEQYALYSALEGYAKDYASFMLFAAPIYASQFVMNQCLRAEGNAFFSMVGLVSGAVLNIALDPLLIHVCGLGVRGAAIATAISQLVSFSILLSTYFRGKSLLRISIRKVHFSREIVGEVTKMGSPGLFRNGLTTIATIITNNMASGFSVAALAAISVVNRIMMFITSAILGYGQGYQPVAGFNWGAKRYDRVLDAMHFMQWTGTIAISILALAVGIFARPIIGVFSTNEETIRVGVFSLVLQCVALPIHAWCIVTNMTYAALGKAAGAAVLSLSRQGIFFIPAVALLPLIFDVYGLASAQAVADILSFALTLPLAVRVSRELKQRAAEAGQPVNSSLFFIERKGK